jgi:hypothetical protein
MCFHQTCSCKGVAMKINKTHHSLQVMVYFIRKLNQKPFILTFGQFEHIQLDSNDDFFYWP